MIKHDPLCALSDYYGTRCTCGAQMRAEAKAMLAEHDHLHLDGKPCADGDMVRCKCGGYHH